MDYTVLTLTETVNCGRRSGMNEKFLELPCEKRRRIINAAMEVFACNEYKHASTEDIAAKAGISKGLLFYYFHNKKELYLYVFDQCEKTMRQHILGSDFSGITDFFELLTYASQKKLEMLRAMPYCMDFVMRVYFSGASKESGEMQRKIQDAMDITYDRYFKNIDFGKFREGTDVETLLHMLTWMTEGYLHERQRLGGRFDPEEILTDFRKWSEMLRKIAYKEEYQDERD